MAHSPRVGRLSCKCSTSPAVPCVVCLGTPSPWIAPRGSRAGGIGQREITPVGHARPRISDVLVWATGIVLPKTDSLLGPGRESRARRVIQGSRPHRLASGPQLPRIDATRWLHVGSPRVSSPEMPSAERRHGRRVSGGGRARPFCSASDSGFIRTLEIRGCSWRSLPSWAGSASACFMAK